MNTALNTISNLRSSVDWVTRARKHAFERFAGAAMHEQQGRQHAQLQPGIGLRFRPADEW